MSRRTPHIKYLFIVLLIFVCARANMAAAEQIMTPLSGPNGTETGSGEALIQKLDLKMYEAALGDLSLCAEDKNCLESADRIKFLVCAADVCAGKDQSKNAFDCFKGYSNPYPQELQDRIGSALCAVIESPGALSRQTLLSHTSDDPYSTEDNLVEYGAYLMAIKGSGDSCKEYIKNYVGQYGLKWKFSWYKALSGCRILSGERTPEQEEKDFYTWFGVVQGSGHCSDIVNSEMRNACSAPGSNPMP